MLSRAARSGALRIGRILSCKRRFWPVLAVVITIIYLIASLSFMIQDKSLSSLGFVHNSDEQLEQLVGRTLPRVKDQPPSSCKANIEVVTHRTLGDGCFFKDRIQCEGMPTINSAFFDVVDRNVVFIGTLFQNESWINETFICEFPDSNVSLVDPVVIDDRSMGTQPQYVFVMTCPIPDIYFTSFLPHNLPDRLHVNLLENSTLFQSYRDVPLCKAGWNKVHYLAICTMVNNVDEYFDDWLLYYRYMGIDHVYVYDNSKDGTIIGVLDRFISLGFVTVIPWSHTFTPTKTYLEVQIAHENDCLWRHRHDTDWILKIDVDEFMQPMFETETRLVDFLHEFEQTLPPSIGIVRVRNWFFSRPSSNVSKEIMSGKSVIERNPWRSPEPTREGRGREKCFIRPQWVHYFKIHAMKLGGDSVTLDPQTEIRLVHYRSENPRHRNFRIHKFIPDNSMVNLWKSINRWVLFTKDRVVMYGYREHLYKT
ncbi:uncharacterized protein LOC100891536 [Strongylocentrotus purpuratus]|uniref:Glycosyltransferase family 92 protein n=1 Tax=Strongylocentrotus purpuratus TaxID=7668 RepID=A0A7M7HPV8_STRPU|nr:uncharacterized protein LOC100891536 [Strongylocentrotus purpuratus]